MERKNKITTSKQFETLISELEKKPHLARGIHRGTTHVNTFKKDWEEITRKLNAQGPPMRPCEGWLRVWKDFKFKLRKKLMLKEVEEKGGGGVKYKSVILFPVEKAAAKLICFDNQFNSETSTSEFQLPMEESQSQWEEEETFESGDHSVVEVKTEDYYMMDHTQLGDEEYFPSTSVNSFQIQMLPSPDDSSKKKRSRKSERQHELLEKHSDMQKKVFYEISSTMNEMKTILKDSAYCQRKILEIEKRKLEIMERRNEREEQLFKTEMKLKFLEMKIKTKELEELEKKSKS